MVLKLLSKVRTLFDLKQRGVALMMVVTTLATISLFLVEIAFHGQLTLKLSYDRLDQVRALYLAKTGYKLSLMRLKAFQKLSEGIKAAGGANGALKNETSIGSGLSP
jgi:hypothetical protein